MESEATEQEELDRFYSSSSPASLPSREQPPPPPPDEHLTYSYTYTTPPRASLSTSSSLPFPLSPPPSSHPLASSHPSPPSSSSSHLLSPSSSHIFPSSYQSTPPHHPHPSSSYSPPYDDDPSILTDDLLNSDPSPSLSLSLPDLDTFFTRLYSYYTAGGLYPTLLSRATGLLTLSFSILFSSFLLLNVRWAALWACRSQDCDGVQLITWDAYTHPTPTTHLVVVYFALFSLYWLWHLLAFLYLIKPTLDMRHFYSHHLHLSDAQLPLLPWSDVLERVVALQHSTKLCTYRTLTQLDITNRIMRKDNFLIALINADTIDVRIHPTRPSLHYEPIHSLGPHHHPTAAAEDEEAVSSAWEWGTLLESVVRRCVLDHIPSSDFTLSTSYTGAQAATSLRRRFYWYGVLTLLFLPFLFLFLTLLFILRHAEELHHKRGSLSSSSRQWSSFSQWKLREYNELPHFFQHRLALASHHATDYLHQFPSPLTSILCGGIAYCAAAVVGVLLLMTLSGSAMDAHLYDRSLLWWLALFSAILAISRSFVHTPPSSSPTHPSSTPTPSLSFSRLTSFTHYHPRQWRGLEHTSLVCDAVSSMYQTPISAFLREMAALLVCPFVLLSVLPSQSGRVVDFVVKHSAEVSGVGVVCDSARFELSDDVHVREEEGGEEEEEKGAGRRRRRRKERRDGKEAVSRRTGKEGKIEKSFLSFSVNHQRWKVEGEDEEEQQRRLAKRGGHASIGGRERFLLSIAEDAQQADAALPFSSSTRSSRRAGERSGPRGRRREHSADSLGSGSSNESLSPSRSPSPSSQSLSAQALTASDRHLLTSFADLLTDSTRTARSILTPSRSSFTSSSTLNPHLLSLPPHASATLRGSRTGPRMRTSGVRMMEEMRESVGEVMRERMFAVLERRVEEEEEEGEGEGVGGGERGGGGGEEEVEMKERGGDRHREDASASRVGGSMRDSRGSQSLQLKSGSLRRTRVELPAAAARRGSVAPD